ncbi:MAG: NirA family protein, partial [Vulcanimicrobiaceae bacterium]
MASGEFAPAQKEYLAGFFTGAAARAQLPYVAKLSSGALVSAPQSGLSNEAAEPPEPTVFGVPLSELAREELIK